MMWLTNTSFILSLCVFRTEVFVRRRSVLIVERSHVVTRLIVEKERFDSTLVAGGARIGNYVAASIKRLLVDPRALQRLRIYSLQSIHGVTMELNLSTVVTMGNVLCERKEHWTEEEITLLTIKSSQCIGLHSLI